MLRAYDVEQVREAERVLMPRLPGEMLMQRAAQGLAIAVVGLLGSAYGRRVLLLVGSGHNGGDTLWAGAMLARRGAHVEAWLLSDTVHDEGLAALVRAGGRVVDRPRLWPEVVLDGIVGIGGRPGLSDDVVRALRLLDGIPIVAVDTPSGVGVDTGELDGDHVEATLTVSFGTLKPCHLLDPAAAACGAVHVVDIGIDPREADVEALEREDVARLLPRPVGDAQKYSRGVVGIRAGSTQYPGAALLSVAGADTGLCGMVRYVGHAAVAETVRSHRPEVVGAGRVQAWVVGSGGGKGAGEELTAAVADGVPLVVDADALGHLARPAPAGAVLTPHAGELAAMLGVERSEIEARPLHFARLAADAYCCVVLLKGRRTVIARPDGRVRVNMTGTAWLATAGAGDVLGGVIGALLAAGLSTYDAASVGAWLHGAAAVWVGGGEVGSGPGGGPLTASEVARAVPVVVRQVLRGGLGSQV